MHTVLLSALLAACVPALAAPVSVPVPQRVDVTFECSVTMQAKGAPGFPAAGQAGTVTLPCHYRLIAEVCEVSGTPPNTRTRCHIDDLGAFKVSPGEMHRVASLPPNYKACTSPLQTPTVAECAAQQPR